MTELPPGQIKQWKMRESARLTIGEMRNEGKWFNERMFHGKYVWTSIEILMFIVSSWDNEYFIQYLHINNLVNKNIIAS